MEDKLNIQMAEASTKHGKKQSRNCYKWIAVCSYFKPTSACPFSVSFSNNNYQVTFINCDMDLKCNTLAFTWGIRVPVLETVAGRTETISWLCTFDCNPLGLNIQTSLHTQTSLQILNHRVLGFAMWTYKERAKIMKKKMQMYEAHKASNTNFCHWGDMTIRLLNKPKRLSIELSTMGHLTAQKKWHRRRMGSSPTALRGYFKSDRL